MEQPEICEVKVKKVVGWYFKTKNLDSNFTCGTNYFNHCAA